MSAPTIDPRTAVAVIDLGAHRHNLAEIGRIAGGAELMAVVKADGYGHGLVEIARSARAAGAQWLGAAVPAEALALRAAGDTGRIFCWLRGPAEDLGDLVAADIDLSVSGLGELEQVIATGRPARIHLKIDTGLHRNGSTAADWPGLVAAAVAAEKAGAVTVVGIWSHLAAADEPGHRSVPLQLAAFDRALEIARAGGLDPRTNHLANSAGTLVLPASHHQLVRVGIAGYGVDPAPGIAALAGVDLRPVMTLRSMLVNVKPVPAGGGVSYGHSWIAPQDTVVGLVPLGYADGVPRAAGNTAEVLVNGRRVPIRGRVCMDQFVVELGAEAIDRVGDEVVLFGDPATGAPSANDWGAACDTIGYEIVTRIGARVPRVATP